MFDEGVNELEGGILAKKYISPRDRSKSTATRYLQPLISIEAIKPGALLGRNGSYELSLPSKDQFIKF